MTASTVGPGRAVEILHDRGPATREVRWAAGSGYLIGRRLVLTAAHNVDYRQDLDDDGQLFVRSITGGEWLAEVVLVCDEMSQVDLALLKIIDPRFDDHLMPVNFARVDRDNPVPVAGCWAVGFPRFSEAGAVLLGGSHRETWHVRGDILPGAKLRADLLSLQVTSTPQSMTTSLSGSAWEGMSGAVVFATDTSAGEYAIGVISTHHRPEGESALTVVPITAVDRLSAAAQWWTQLGVADPSALLVHPPPSPADQRMSHLRAYLKAARSAAQRHPYTIFTSNVPELSSVYLPQELSPFARQPRPRPSLAPSKTNNLPAVERRAAVAEATRLVQTFDPWEALDHYRGMIIFGGPGTGKSSLLHNIALTTADAWLAGIHRPFVPVLVHADTLTERLPLPDVMAGAVLEEMGARLDASNLSDLFAAQPVSGTPWLVLVDGMDEILDATARANLLETIAYWWYDERYRFVIASRMLPPAELSSLSAIEPGFFEIQPFSDDQLLVLAERWFTACELPDIPELTDRFIGQLLHGRLRQLAKVPLIASVICMIFASDPTRPLPPSRADLYERFVSSLIDKPFEQFNALERLQSRLRPYGEEPQHAIDNLLHHLRALMQFLALNRMFDHADHPLVDAVGEFATLERPSQLPDSTWQRILAEVLRQSGLLLQRGEDFVFIHHTVMEYLAACAVSDSRRLGRRHRLMLAVNAGQGESYSLFTIAVLRRKGTDLARRAPKLMNALKLIHARLVAALTSEGVDIDEAVTKNAIRQLTKVINRTKTYSSTLIGRALWGEEDDRVLAAKSLLLLDPDRGYEALARVAVDWSVGGFNVFDLIAGNATGGELAGFDKDRSMDALLTLTSTPGQDDFHRMLIANLVFETDRDRGILLFERIIRDSTVVGTFRMECISRLLKVDHARGADALVSFLSDPHAELLLRFRALERLSKFDLGRYYAALESIATNPENGGLARSLATGRLLRDRPMVGGPATLALTANEDIDGFHRVEPLFSVSSEIDRNSRLAELSSDSTMAAKWRIFAADQLVAYDASRGIDALRDLSRDSGMRWRLRLQAIISAWIYQLKIRFGED